MLSNPLGPALSHRSLSMFTHILDGKNRLTMLPYASIRNTNLLLSIMLLWVVYRWYLIWRLNKPFIFGPVGGGHVAPPAFKKYFGNQWNGFTETVRSFAVEQVVPFNPSSRRTLNRANWFLLQTVRLSTLPRTRCAPY
jgi:hypothetical protein